MTPFVHIRTTVFADLVRGWSRVGLCYVGINGRGVLPPSTAWILNIHARTDWVRKSVHV